MPTENKNFAHETHESTDKAKRTPLTNRVIEEKSPSFGMVVGDGYAMPVMGKRQL